MFLNVNGDLRGGGMRQLGWTICLRELICDLGCQRQFNRRGQRGRAMVFANVDLGGVGEADLARLLLTLM